MLTRTWQNPTALRARDMAYCIGFIRLKEVVRTNAAEQLIQPPFDTTSNERADEASRPRSGAVQCSLERGVGLLASAVDRMVCRA
jgi:hypothetical protein